MTGISPAFLCTELCLLSVASYWNGMHTWIQGNGFATSSLLGRSRAKSYPMASFLTC